MAATAWTDLLDPDEDELRRLLPKDVRTEAMRQLLRPSGTGGYVRPTIRGHGTYVFGVLVAAVAVREEDRIFYQEIDFVLTHRRIVTVRKTPPGDKPYDPAQVREVCEAHRGEVAPGTIAYYLLDDIAERYIDFLDDVHDEIDELEEHVDDWPQDRTRKRISELRHDLLHIRKTLAPTRDAVREVVDGRVDLQGRALFTREVFPREVKQQFGPVYDKLLRAAEAIDYARELLTAVRDYQQSRISMDQNEVTKRLTAIAAIVLVPTFIVGLYGQNFDNIPELKWGFGYWWSWVLILGVTVVQFIYFRRKQWL
jgi:magnesium transporter